jgi:hypothetical protein
MPTHIQVETCKPILFVLPATMLKCFFFLSSVLLAYSSTLPVRQMNLSVLSHVLSNTLCSVTNTGLMRDYSMQPNGFIFPKRKNGHFYNKN